MRDPRAVIFEKCTFKNCTVDGAPIPDVFLEWACSCGHATKEAHFADDLPRKWWQFWKGIEGNSVSESMK